jgi:hypothetical protein
LIRRGNHPRQQQVARIFRGASVAAPVAGAVIADVGSLQPNPALVAKATAVEVLLVVRPMTEGLNHLRAGSGVCRMRRRQTKAAVS